MLQLGRRFSSQSSGIMCLEWRLAVRIASSTASLLSRERRRHLFNLESSLEAKLGAASSWRFAGALAVVRVRAPCRVMTPKGPIAGVAARGLTASEGGESKRRATTEHQPARISTDFGILEK